MIGVAAALALGSLVGLLNPAAAVAAALLFWSGLVKVIVLRVWRATLASPAEPEPIRLGLRSGSATLDPR
jgi:hypothetical protein